MELWYIFLYFILFIPTAIIYILLTKVLILLESFFQYATIPTSSPMYNINSENLEKSKFLKFLHKL